MKTITSKFGGKCPKCGLRFAVGSTIAHLSSGGWGHVECALGKAPPERKDIERQIAQNLGATPRREFDTVANLPSTTQHEDGVVRTEFDSVNAIAEVALTMGMGRGNSGASQGDSMVREYSGGEFFNYYTPEKFFAAQEQTPAELLSEVTRVKDAIEKFIDAPTTPRRKLRRNLEDGAELDPMAWVNRRTDGWDDIKRERVNKPVIRIAVNVVMSSCQRADELVHRGAAAVAMADILSQRGHSVELVAFWATDNTASDMKTQVTSAIVKPSDAPLNIGAAALALAEIAFSRMIMMPAVARLSGGKVNSFMGMVRRLPEADLRGFDAIVDTNVNDFPAAVEAVKALMAKVN